MKIKHVILAANVQERIALIFKQLGAKIKEHNGQSVLSIVTDPDTMEQKVEIAFEQLKRLGYDNKTQAQKHFWYIKNSRHTVPTITIESQGASGFVMERHEYLIH
jgi:Holliday junction resolvasome RuvABC DNA-binding subunit